jgi:ATP-binding cassette subfamily F protein uup
MALLALQDVTVALGGPALLEHASLLVQPGERVAVVGRNGAGKTTLLRLVAGEILPRDGEVIRRQGLSVAALPQEIPPDLDGTTFDIVVAGLGDAGRLVADYHDVGHRLAESSDDALLRRLDRLHRDIDARGAWALHHRAETVLSHLGLDPDAQFSDLSGGRKRQTLLARALVSEPDLLLLDEPTNHLDIDAISWLEEYLLGSGIALLLVTHDRAFLRRLATRIVELDRGTLRDWGGDYDTYLTRRDALLEAEAREWAELDRKLAEEETWIGRSLEARRTRNMGRVRALERLRQERRDRRERQGTARMQMQEVERSGRSVIEARDVSFAYAGKPVVRGFSTVISRGDKVGLIGPNGSGKTTLLRLLLGELQPQAGTVRQGTNLEIAYFDQLREQLDPTATAEQIIADGSDRVVIDGRPKHVLGYLQDFLFTPERARQPIRSLSGGERNRLLLARLFTRRFNLLVLDEPTNDLDLETLDLLESLLVSFEGTLLVVSHDRAFLDNVVTGVLVFEGGGHVGEYVGGYSDWARQAERRRVMASTRPDPAAGEQARAADRAASRTATRKLTYAESLELGALPDRIDALEREQRELHERMADPAFYRSAGDAIAAARARLDALETELALAYERWEVLAARAE